MNKSVTFSRPPGCLCRSAGLHTSDRRATGTGAPGYKSFCDKFTGDGIGSGGILFLLLLLCSVLYCIVGFSGFLYIRKALLISGENWMFGFGFSAFLFVCFFRRVFCFKTCLFDSSSSRLLGAFLCLPMLFYFLFQYANKFYPLSLHPQTERK